MYTLLLDILDVVGSSMEGLLFVLSVIILVAAKAAFCVGGLLVLANITK
jgi:hypothetical protein